MTEEFELTYLAKEFPPQFSTDLSQKEIIDIYIPKDAEHPGLRIRKNGEKYEITKKEPISGTDSSHQSENTIPLTKDEFASLAELPGKRVRKVRYYYEEDGVNYEVDVFKDALAGLVVVDIEFDSKEEKDAFTPPPWVLVDVTQDKFIAGGMLCGKSYADIEPELLARNYQKLTV